MKAAVGIQFIRFLLFLWIGYCESFKYSPLRTMHHTGTAVGDTLGNMVVSELGGRSATLTEKWSALYADDKLLASEKPRGKKRSTAGFSRTNRLEGQFRWMREIYLIRQQQQQQHGHGDPTGGLFGIGVVVELAKELLYSGIPEQVLELYAAYYDVVVQGASGDGSNAAEEEEEEERGDRVPVVQHAKLVAVAIRAFVTIEDTAGALALLSAATRCGLIFDADSSSAIIANLATCSEEGLRAALDMRARVVKAGYRINANGYAGLLRGILDHWLSGTHPQDVLLLDPTTSSSGSGKDADSDEPSFHLSPAEVQALGRDLMNEFLLRPANRKNRSNKVLSPPLPLPLTAP